MSQLADHALSRLVSLLPLASRQAILSPELRRLHQTFLRTLAERGRVPSGPEIAAAVPSLPAFDAIWTLASLDLVVVDPLGRPVGAYPLTTMETPHEIIVKRNRLWAMCALDALSVAPLFETETTIASHCPVTGDLVSLRMSGNRVLEASPGRDVRLGVWWRDPRSCAARNFCPGVMFLRDDSTALRWQALGAGDHDFMPLDDAVDVAARFFRPLLTEAPLGVPAMA